MGRVTWTKDPLGHIAQNEYSDAGRLLKTIAPSPFNYETTYEYYADGKLQHVKQVVPGGYAGSGNDFSHDNNCVALWRLESGALTTDSKGTNTLTNTGVAESTAVFKEGACAADFELGDNDDNLQITDALMSQGFPGRSTDTNKKLSVTFWVRFESVPGTGAAQALFSKMVTNKYTYQSQVYNASGTPQLKFYIGYNGGADMEGVAHDSAIQAGRWYHVGVTYDDSTRNYRIRIWDDEAGAILGTDKIGTFTNNMNVEDAPFRLGTRGDGVIELDGLLDEVVVFKDILTPDEIDDIRQENYAVLAQPNEGFSVDPNCVALWQMESGDLTADSKGTNTLTNTGVSESTGIFKEGACAADFELGDNDDNLQITDALMSGDFPGRSTDTNKKLSVAFWVRFESLPGQGSAQAMFSKMAANKYTYQCQVYNASGTTQLKFYIGYNGGADMEGVAHDSAIQAGRWYHVGVTYDDSTRNYRIRIWDDEAGAILGTDKTGTFSNSMNVEDAPFRLGTRGDGIIELDGLLDEVVVFNDILTTTEIDQIRQGAYGGSGTPQTIYLQSITYNKRGQKTETWGPYPENPTSQELQINRTKYSYDNLGRLTDVNDAEGNITTTRYCADGKVWKVIDAEGHATVTHIYNKDGSLKETLDANGNSTSRQYNGFMSLRRTTFEDGTYEEADYDEYRRFISRRNRAGETITVSYGEDGALIEESYSENTVSFKYDILRRVVETTDNSGTIRTFYDRVGRVSRIEYPGSKNVRYEYDAAGNRTKLTYPDNTYITYEYDNLGRLTAVKDSAGTPLAEYTYDALSRRTGLEYANGSSIGYEYDTASRLLGIDNQVNNGQHLYEYTYDKVSNRLTMEVTDPGGTSMHVYEYDKVYQVTDADYPADFSDLATDTTFDYDPVGNRTTVVDGGGTSTYTTNDLNQYTALDSVNYSYDDKGNMTQDEAHTYTYDAKNRLRTVTKNPPSVGPLAAACDTNLTLTTGGDGEWFSQTSDYYYDGDAVRSGEIDANEATWLETTVEGPGTISFWWKVSSALGDEVNFYIDGVWKTGRAGNPGWDSYSEPITGSQTHTFRWRYHKDGADTAGSDCAWVDYIVWTPSGGGTPPNILHQYVDSWLSYTTGGDQEWSGTTGAYYYDGDSAQNDDLDDGQQAWMQTTVEGEGTFSFYWKVSSQSNYDWLEFYVDSVRQDRISGSVAWTLKSYNLSGMGTHTLKWVYVKDGWVSEGSDCGWVDYVQWTGVMPVPPEWETITYTYDPNGRRIAKAYDDTPVVKYLYDGDQCIAEYASNDRLLRKYIYGPGVDQPICMIEVEDSNTVYYYHYDGLGSVVALTDEEANAVQFYDYSVYGQVSASNPNHPNRFMFTGREFDKDTGLYYYRARYYNPEIGRFLQSDPARNGTNWYAYCRNNPIGLTDSSGCVATLIDERYDIPGWRYYLYDVNTITDVRWVIDKYGSSGLYLYNEIELLLNWPNYSDWRAKHRITIGVTTVGGVTVITLNRTGLLDSPTLDAIIRGDVARVNEWKGGLERNWWKLIFECDTPFYEDGKSRFGVGKWLFVNTIYGSSDINYVLEGHAMRHIGLGYFQAWDLVVKWKFFAHGRLPWQLSGALFWFTDGFWGYDNRKSW